MRHVTSKQDVLLRDNWFPSGTSFVVKDEPDPEAKPVQVDPRTADAWIAQQWASEGKPEAKAHAG